VIGIEKRKRLFLSLSLSLTSLFEDFLCPLGWDVSSARVENEKESVRRQTYYT